MRREYMREWNTWHAVKFPVTIGDTTYNDIRTLLKDLRTTLTLFDFKSIKYSFGWEIKMAWKGDN